ncbi:MAG: PIN domain-containing protein [Trebonia sp.]
MIDLVLTDRLLAEWQRVMVREGHRAPESAEKIVDLIRTGFASSIVPEHSYRQHLQELEVPDPDDLHHMAAAIAAGADTLITWNVADFPPMPSPRMASPSARLTPIFARSWNATPSRSCALSRAWPPRRNARH